MDLAIEEVFWWKLWLAYKDTMIQVYSTCCCVASDWCLSIYQMIRENSWTLKFLLVRVFYLPKSQNLQELADQIPLIHFAGHKQLRT